MRPFYLAPALLLLALLAACSDTPDDGVIRDALNQELKQAHLDELFQVTDVETAGRYPEDDDHVALVALVEALHLVQGGAASCGEVAQPTELAVVARSRVVHQQPDLRALYSLCRVEIFQR